MVKYSLVPNADKSTRATPSFWASIGDATIEWSEQEDAPGLREAAQGRLHLVIQVGDTFRMSHPDARVVLERGRHLIVDMTSCEVKRFTDPDECCWTIRSLPRTSRITDIVHSAPRVADPAITSLLGNLSTARYQANLEHLASFRTQAEVLELDPAGESRLLVKGRIVVVRPGETAIREGGRGRSVEDVTEGRRIHVKGVFLAPEDGREVVLAREIKLQGGGQDDDGDDDEADDDDGGDDDDDDETCAVAEARVGSGIELEGAVSTGASAAFAMRVQGNRASVAVDVDASGAEFKCNGPGSPTAAECRARLGPGVRVHVSGTVQACDTTSAAVRAARVMVKK